MNATTQRLTLAQIKKLPLPASGYIEQNIGGIEGFRVRVYASGIRSFMFRYKSAGKNNCTTIGQVGVIKYSDAESKAKVLRREVNAGNDPVGARREQEVQRRLAEQQREREEKQNPTFSNFAAEYLHRHCKKLKKSWKQDEQNLNKHVLPVIGTLRINVITRRDIIDLLDTIRDAGHDVTANRVRALLHHAFQWAIKRAYLEHNPVTLTERTTEKSRERILTYAEIRHLVTTKKGVIGDALHFVLVSGQRTGEVRGMKWADISEGVWTISETKNGRVHVVPLSDAMQAIINARKSVANADDIYVFPGVGGRMTHKTTPPAYMERMKWESDNAPTPHDLRRTAITTISRLGHNRTVQNAIANHVDNSIGGIYDRYDYMKEKAAALEALGAEIERIVKGAKVLEFKPKAGI